MASQKVITEIEKQLIELDKKYAVLQEALLKVENRIGDLGGLITLGTAGFAIVITILAIILGFFVYRNAQETAKNEAQKWLEENGYELNHQLDALKETSKAAIEKHRQDLEQQYVIKEKAFEHELKIMLATDINDKKMLISEFIDLPISNDKKYVFLDSLYKQPNMQELLDDIYISKFKENKIDKDLFSNQIVDSYLSVAHKLSKNDSLEKVTAVYDELVSQFKDSKIEEIQVRVAISYFNKGIMLAQFDQSDKAVQVYDELISQFKDSKNEEIQVILAKAYFNKGFTLGALDQYEKEVQVYDELISQFKDSKNEEIQVRVARAYFNKGITLVQLDQSEKAVQVYDELISQFKDSKIEEIQVILAKAYFNNGVALGDLDQSEKAVQVYDEFISQFKDSKNEEIQVRVARAYFNKGITLVQHDQSEKAVQVYDELISQFKDSKNEEIQVRVARAYFNKGI
ncbi:tetratricopeptide repeat protein, partial [Acinetobacter guillouiae]|uniref:tetratricopeptide repeat protein n=1 Tax=Acinetobacter guillouiae TaxID=106649 RepID=UPI003AF99698